MNIYQWVLCFFIYGCAGWLMEELFYAAATRKIVSRGFLYGPVCPIYGAGSLAIILLCQSFSGHPLLLFLLGVLLTTVLEYVTSYLLEKCFNTHYWDYSGFFMNINGRVCIPFSLAWGFLTIILVLVIHPAVSYAVMAATPYEAMLADLVLCFILLLDTIMSVAGLLSRRAPSKQSDFFLSFSFLFSCRESPAAEEKNSRFICALQKKYAEIVVRREWNNYVTQQISSAFPFLTNENVHKTAGELKKRFCHMLGRQ